MASLSDVDDYKIETEIPKDGNFVVNYEYVTDVESGMRNVKFEKIWYREATISHGQISDVWLEVHKGVHESRRAVKAIRKKKLLQV